MQLLEMPKQEGRVGRISTRRDDEAGIIAPVPRAALSPEIADHCAKGRSGVPPLASPLCWNAARKLFPARLMPGHYRPCLGMPRKQLRDPWGDAGSSSAILP